MAYKKFIIVLFFLFFIGAILYKYFFYLDIQKGCYIKILPSVQGGNTLVKKSIKVLKYGSPSDYEDLCKHVNTIDLNYLSGGGFYYISIGKTIFVDPRFGLQDVSRIIVHEVCHARQRQEGRFLSEEECYKKDDEFIKKITSF